VVRPFRDVFPVIDPTAFIDETAQVIGDVQVGEACSVWMNAVIRGDVNFIRIGRRSNVQDGTIIHVNRDPSHPTLIGEEVTIGHGVLVHGCTIEDRCLIGMGAIVLNGSHIGAGSIVAAGALVPEGARIPPGSMVMGLPARVRRALTPEETASLAAYAENYVRYRLDYMPRSVSAS
jgi:carbonic anhydrase/acetyltransferase-like protein (isoleucine patch superfamily)